MPTIYQKKNLKAKAPFELYPEEQAQAYLEDDLKVMESGKPKLFLKNPGRPKKVKNGLAQVKFLM